MIELTVHIPDVVFERLQRDAADRHTQPEQVASDALQSIFAPSTDPIPVDVATTVARLQTWLAEQPAQAVRPPLALDQEDQAKLDDDLEQLLTSFHERTKNISLDQLQQDVTDALKDT